MADVSTTMKMKTKTKTTWRKRLFSILRIVTLLYAALCLVARLGYPRLLFPAPRMEEAEMPRLDSEVALLRLPHPDGSRTLALRYPPPPKDAAHARYVVLFHGNGQTMFGETHRARQLRAQGFGVMLVEYRGYGLTYGSSPSEEMLYEDGEAAIQSLADDGIKSDRIVLWGWSLGSGVAAEMARRHHGARLILLSPFTSITDMGRRFAPILPVSLLLSHRFDTLSKAPEITVPTIVVHGDLDEVIPFEMGERVAKAIPNAQFVRVKGGHHADIHYEDEGLDPPASAVTSMLVAFAGAN